MFATKAKDSSLKIIDFGLSKIYKPEEEIAEENEKKVGINLGQQFRGRKKVVMQTKAGTVSYSKHSHTTSHLKFSQATTTKNVTYGQQVSCSTSFCAATHHSTVKRTLRF